MEENSIEQKIFGFLKQNINIILIVILIFAFILRFKYFNINSAVWWDEAEYLSTAKHWVLSTPYDISPQRQPLLPLVISFFYKIGIFNLSVVKFFIGLLPSLAIVFITYLLGKSFFNKATGLIASFIMSIFWVLLFWTSRISTDVLGFLFGLLAIYFFWSAYENKSNFHAILAGVFLGLGFLTRVGGVLIVIILAIYLIFTKNIRLIKDKRTYLLGITSLLLIIPYLIWNQIKFGNALAFWKLYFGATKATAKLTSPIAWNVLSFPQLYLGKILFAIFLLGLIIILVKVILGFDLVLKNRKEPKVEFLLILTIIVPLIFFTFVERNAEPRWPIIMSVAIFIIVARGLIYLHKKLSSYIPNYVSILIIVAILLTGSAYNLQTSQASLETRKDSYSQFKEAGLWLKENTPPDTNVYCNGVPQLSYYSERKIYPMGGKQEEFEEVMKERNIKYIVISLLEIEPQWISQETFLPNGLNWKLPHFETELLVQDGKGQAILRGEPINTFPPPEIIKNDVRYNLVYQISGLFIYEVNFLSPTNIPTP